MNKPANLDQAAKIVSMIASRAIGFDLAEALIDGRVEIVQKPGAPTERSLATSSQDNKFFTMPNISPAELVSQANGFVYRHYRNSPDFQQLEFILDEAGKTFEPIIWCPDHSVSSQEVREHFQQLGADGNFAAFLYWVMKSNPKGNFTTIPSSDDALFRHGKGGRGVMCFRNREARKFFPTGRFTDMWGKGRYFVGFRPVAGR